MHCSPSKEFRKRRGGWRWKRAGTSLWKKCDFIWALMGRIWMVAEVQILGTQVGNCPLPSPYQWIIDHSALSCWPHLFSESLSTSSWQSLPVNYSWPRRGNPFAICIRISFSLDSILYLGMGLCCTPSPQKKKSPPIPQFKHSQFLQ